MTQRYCRNCGAELETGDRYCSECGQSIDGDAVESDQHTDVRDDPGSQQGWGADGDDWGGPSDAGTGSGTQYDSSTTRGGYGRGGQPDTTLAAITHVLGLFTWLIGPFIVYLVADDPFVKENAAKATDWQIMFTLYMVVAFALVFVLIGFVLLFVLPLLNMAFIVIAALKASEGEVWTYPLTPSIL